MTRKITHLPFYRSRGPALKLQLSLLEKLAKLLDNGYTIIQALAVMQWDERITNYCRSLTEYLKEGRPLDEAFQLIYFDEEVTTYLYFARTNGELTSTIKQCAEMMRNRMASLKKFKQAARYPLFLLLLSGSLLWFVKESVYPAFYDLFSSSGTPSPVLTTSMIMIDFLFLFLQILFIGLLLLIPCVKILQHRTEIDFQLQVYQKVPLYRVYLRKRITFLFSLHLSSLFHAGFSPKEAFESISNQEKHPILSHYATHILEELKTGTSLASILPMFYFLEADLQSIFQKQATTSWIEKDLTAYAEFLIEQMQEQIRNAASFIQPAVFCLLGFLIVFIYLSIMLPMFQLINSI